MSVISMLLHHGVTCCIWGHSVYKHRISFIIFCYCLDVQWHPQVQGTEMVTMAAKSQGHSLNQQMSSMNSSADQAISGSQDTSQKDTLLVSWHFLAFVSSEF